MALAAHTSEPSEADRLTFLSSPQGKVENFAKSYTVSVFKLGLFYLFLC